MIPWNRSLQMSQSGFPYDNPVNGAQERPSTDCFPLRPVVTKTFHDCNYFDHKELLHLGLKMF